MTLEDQYKITAEERRGVRGSELTGEIGIDRREIEWRKEFTGFGPDDAARLEGMGPLFEPVADDIVDAFYSHLQSYSETTAILGSSDKTIEDLERTATQYLFDLFEGTYDTEYFDRRARVGKIHDMLDMPPKVYLGAYVIFYEGVLSTLGGDTKDRLEDVARPADDGEQLVPLSEAKAAVSDLEDRALSGMKLLNLDQQVAIDTYIHSYADIEEELERQEDVAENVTETVTELRNTSETARKHSREIESLADEQEGSMSEVAGEVSNLSATVEQIASNAEEVTSTSEDAQAVAQEAVDSAEGAIEKMGSVEEAASEVSEDVERLRERVDRIDEIVEVINDIADQTNLLALNASIEAAHANEAGDGFAVVANEVKSLAEESQEEASNIERMVKRIQEDTEETVESLEEANAEIDEGVDRVEETVENLERIEGSVREATTGIQEVADATDDQAASTEEVASMTDTTMENAQVIAEKGDRINEENRNQLELVKEIQAEIERLTDENRHGR